jgi:hypothetical protein
VYYPLLLCGKKRYAGLWWTTTEKYDKRDVKGMESVRRDSCKLVSGVIEKVIDNLLTTRKIESMMEPVDRAIDGIRNDTIDMSELVISKALSKEPGDYNPVPPHAKLAIKLARREAAAWVDRLSPDEFSDRISRMEERLGCIVTRERLIDELAKDRNIAVTAPRMGSRVPYFVVSRSSKKARGPSDVKTSDKAEDPDYVVEHNCPIDRKYYIENQLRLPVERVIEPLVPGITNRKFGTTACTIYVPQNPGAKDDKYRDRIASVPLPPPPPKQAIAPPPAAKGALKGAAKRKAEAMAGQRLLFSSEVIQPPTKKPTTQELIYKAYDESLKKQARIASALVPGQSMLFSDKLISAPNRNLERATEGAVALKHKPRITAATPSTSAGCIGRFITEVHKCLYCGERMAAAQQDLPPAYCDDCNYYNPEKLPAVTDFVMEQYRRIKECNDHLWETCRGCQNVQSIEELRPCKTHTCPIFYKRNQVRDRARAISTQASRVVVAIEYEASAGTNMDAT